MAEKEIDPNNITAYASNSQKARREQKPERRELEKVVTSEATLRKESLGRRMRKTFVGDDAQSVGSYVLFEVIIPSTKNLLFDMLSEGARRLLFGGASRPTAGSPTLGSRSSYATKVYSGGSSSAPPSRPQAQVAQVVPMENEVLFATRGEATMVQEALSDEIGEYGTATVANLKELIGKSAEFTDRQRGWTDLQHCSIHQTREGFLLVLPPVQSLAS